MWLTRARFVRLGPLEEVEFDCRSDGLPSRMVVLHGEGGTGRSTILSSIAATRPGHQLAQTTVYRRAGGAAYCVCDWHLGADDPIRPHPLRVWTPGVQLGATPAEDQTLRREIALFEQKANERGFIFVGIPAGRRFPRASVAIIDPLRSLLRHDPRASPGFTDPARQEMTRGVKQILAYAACAAGLQGDDKGQSGDTRTLAAALREGVDAVSSLVGFRYRGVAARTLEPIFQSPGGGLTIFDALPEHLRHLISFVALPTQLFWVGSGGQDPREVEGVVAIDDVELYQPERVREILADTLRALLPRAQWILGTSSPEVARADDAVVVALRHLPDSDRVEAYQGELAVTH